MGRGNNNKNVRNSRNIFFIFVLFHARIKIISKRQVFEAGIRNSL